jgi:hypothetical protein
MYEGRTKIALYHHNIKTGKRSCQANPKIKIDLVMIE